MKIHYRIASILTVLSMLMSGCATVKLSTQARSYYDQIQASMAKESVAVIADGCVIRSEVGTSHIIAQPSENIGKSIAIVIAEQLKSRGVNVTFANAPFLCGALKEDIVKGYSLANTSDGNRGEINDYPLRPTGQATLPADKVLLQLLAQSAIAKPTLDTNEDTPITPTKIDLSEEQSGAIAKSLNSNFVWVVNVVGKQVSFGRQLGLALLVVALNIGTTRGASTGYYYSIPEDGIVYNVALIRLDTKDILWKKTQLVQGVDPLNEKVYTPLWAAEALSPFFPSNAVLPTK